MTRTDTPSDAIVGPGISVDGLMPAHADIVDSLRGIIHHTSLTMIAEAFRGQRGFLAQCMAEMRDESFDRIWRIPGVGPVSIEITTKGAMNIDDWRRVAMFGALCAGDIDAKEQGT